MPASVVHRHTRRHVLSSLHLALAMGLAPLPAGAAPYLLTYIGTLHAADALTAGSGPDLITDDTPFTFTALFDTGTPNVVAPLPSPGPGQGFVAYIPSSASFTIGGVKYALTGLGSPAGPTISIYDQTNIFYPGRYGIGLIVNPLADGAGFIGDFLSASPAFSVSAFGPTVFEDFAGVGFSAGLGCGPDPAPCTFQPLTLARGGESYALQFGGIAGVIDGTISYDGGSSSAALTALPEPATWAMMVLGFGAIGAAVRGRRRVSVRYR